MIIDKSYIATAETLGLGQVCPCWRVTTFDGTHEEYCPIYRVAVALASAAATQRDGGYMTEDQAALEIAKVVFDHFGILWPKNYEDHTGELIERLRPILVAHAAAQREQDAQIVKRECGAARYLGEVIAAAIRSQS